MTTSILGCPIRAALPPDAAENLQLAVSNLAVHYPGFLQALLDRCTIVEGNIPRAGIKKDNTQYTLTLNFSWLAKLTLSEIVFVLCHEGLHRILMHLELQLYAKTNGMPTPDGSLPFDAQLFGIAADALINRMLLKASIGRMPDEGIRADKLPIRPLTDEDDIGTVYALLFKQGVQLEPLEIMDSSEAAEDVTLEEIAQSVAVNTDTASQLQKTTQAGKGSDLLDRLTHGFQEALIDWREQLAASIIQHNAPGTLPTWRRLDRRMKPLGLTLPGAETMQTGHCVIAHDVSGSIGPDETEQFFAETAAILAVCQPERITILPVDAEVHTPIVVEFDGTSDPAHAHALIMSAAQGIYTGGGGTSFDPPFKWVETHTDELPSQLIYLTDGWGECTVDAPEYPVLWVSTGDADFPFGEIIKL